MPKPLDRKALVIDVESTCWEPPEEQPRNEISEIIEIGIAVVDIDSMKIEKNDSIIVRPQRSRVSNFCTKLTTLTQKIVDDGMTFQAAMAILKRDYKSEDRTFVSWGDYDRKMFERNCKDYGVKYPFGPRHINLKNSFAVLNGLEAEVGLDTAINDWMSFKMTGTHHRGVDDARNIAEIFCNTLSLYRCGRDI